MNRAQLEALRDELTTDPAGLGYAALGQDYPALAALLNARPDVPNPEPRGLVPDLPGSLAEILAILTPAERAAVVQADSIQDLAVRAWTAGQDPVELQVVVAWIAVSPAVEFETVTVQKLADVLLDAGALDVLAALVAVVAADPGLSAETVAALSARLAQTIPDPSWTETVAGDSRATSLNLPTITSVDVQSALNLGA